MDARQKDLLIARTKYPLELKIKMTERRIISYYENNQGQVYIPFSGGKDSTVLAHIARKLYSDIDLVHSRTGLEFPEINKFVKNFGNVTFVQPTMSPSKVIETYGYPIISKQVSNTIRYARKNLEQGKNTLRVRQIMGETKGSKYDKGHYKYLLDAPFKISEQCCKVLKKDPMSKYEKETGKKPMVAIIHDESMTRKSSYLNNGCILKDGSQMNPLIFWTEQDILQYIKNENISICSVYGDIIHEDGKLTTSGEKRTGCLFCTFGIMKEKGENRFQRLSKTHPKLHDFCINKLGYNKVLDYINIKY